MSSMLRNQLSYFALFATGVLGFTGTCAAQTIGQDSPAVSAARTSLVARAPSRAEQAVSQWKYLADDSNRTFAEYAGFVLAYPGFPREDLLRTRAENRLDEEAPTSEQLVAFFDRNPPLTNSGRARYALALAAMQRPEAAQVAREAWRKGKMSGTAEAYLLGLYGSRFQPEDHDARMNALLWQGEQEAAARQIVNVSPADRDIYMARLAMLQGDQPESIGLRVPPNAQNDAGYTYNQVKQLRRSGQGYRAIQILSSRPTFASPAFDAEDFIGEMLATAKSAGARPASQIASKVDDLFAPNADISGMSYRLRDDYTSLMWLGGTKALWELGDGRTAAPLFYRYGAAARTPQTRSKGFYWAGNASARAGDAAEAQRYFAMAAQYPEYFYGLLAMERLGQSVPAFTAQPNAKPTAQQRAQFAADPLVQALKAIARSGYDWRTERYFFTALSDRSDTAEQLQMASELAQELNLPEMAVVVGRTAPEHGITGFERVGFPVVATPGGTNWTMVHAIARQESEFDRNRVSHAGARGLMQLMPGTAREQAGKLGMNYMSADLTGDTQYNIRLGDGYFSRMMDYYGGSYPLAVAAYNAGPGNVNKWLRSNGDPRNGSIDWLRWIEEIPIFETKNYVQRVLENAVVYQAMYPGRDVRGVPDNISSIIGKRTQG